LSRELEEYRERSKINLITIALSSKGFSVIVKQESAPHPESLFADETLIESFLYMETL